MASWLLLQRAASAGELSEEEARQEQGRISLASVAQPPVEENLAHLPRELLALMHRAQRLYERMLRLDEMIRARATPPTSDNHPLAGYLARIASEFGARGR